MLENTPRPQIPTIADPCRDTPATIYLATTMLVDALHGIVLCLEILKWEVSSSDRRCYVVKCACRRDTLPSYFAN